MSTKPVYQVVLVDDHILLRNALATLIDNFGEFRVAGLAANGEEMIKVINDNQHIDLVIADLNMPKMDGYEVVQWLKAKHPGIKILILTMYDSEIAFIRLLKLGVKGFIKKDIHPKELQVALLSIVNDEYYYSNAATGKLATFFIRNARTPASIEKALLNEIEIEFLKLASTEMTYKEIAHAMQLTPRTIDSYRDNLFSKLDVKSRVGLAIYAVKNGLVAI